MKRLLSARIFSLAFLLAYAVAVYFNYPLFRYYPLARRFSLQDLATTSLGPAMSWYGWIASGAVVALVLTVLVPKRLGDRIPAALFWIAIAFVAAAAWHREREWFVPSAAG